MLLETNKTDGVQSVKIDSSSYSVNFTSKGTVIMPESTDAKTQAPYSGFDSDKIAQRSPFFTPTVFIK